MSPEPRWDHTFTLPWPPAKLSPNATIGKNWASVWAVRKRYRAACKAAVQAAMRGRATMPAANRVAAAMVFHPPNGISRDLDGVMGAMKNGLDGAAEALGVDDRVFRPWTLDFGDPVPGGAVVLRLTVPMPDLLAGAEGL